MHTQVNLDRFYTVLAEQYRDLFGNDPRYAPAAKTVTPEEHARKITLGLDNGTAFKDMPGVQRTCKILKIKCTYKAIREFLHAE